MKVIIIEDEGPAAKMLANMLKELISDVEIVGIFDSVEDSVNWLMNNDSPDLGFFDVQLADGLSFEVFELCDIAFPIIFTTAYDEYALKAFEVNSIDYLLKPVSKADVQRSLDKYDGLKNYVEVQSQKIDSLGKEMRAGYKSRFMVRIGEHIKSVPTTTIQYFYSYEKSTWCITKDGKKYLLDYPLEQIAPRLDPGFWFRINRKYLIHFDAVTDIIYYTNSRLKVKLAHSEENDIIVARERVREFKDWLDK